MDNKTGTADWVNDTNPIRKESYPVFDLTEDHVTAGPTPDFSAGLVDMWGHTFKGEEETEKDMRFDPPSELTGLTNPKATEKPADSDLPRPELVINPGGMWGNVFSSEENAMPDDDNWSGSGILNSLAWNNSTIPNNTDTVATLAIEGDIYTRYDDAQLSLQCFVTGCLCVFGLVGNVCALVVLLRDPKKTLISLLLAALCVVDCFLLLYMIPASVVPGACFYWRDCECIVSTLSLIPYLWPWSAFAQTVMIWIIVMATVCRYIAVCHPFSGRHWSTAKRGRIILLGIVLASFIFNLPRIVIAYLERQEALSLVTSDNDTQKFHAVEASFNGDNVANETCFDSMEFKHLARSYKQDFTHSNKYYHKIYYIGLTWVAMYIIPLLLLFVLNVRLAWALRQSIRRHNQLTNSDEKDNQSVTVNIIAVVTVFLVCQTPDFVSVILDYGPTVVSAEARQYFVAVSGTLQAFNSAVDFVLYTLFYKRFRDQARNLFCCLVRRRTYQVPTASTSFSTRSSSDHKNEVVRPTYSKE